MQTPSNPTYSAEINFIKRKLAPCKFKWQPRHSLSQLLSEPLTESQASQLNSDLKNALGYKANYLLAKLVNLIEMKNQFASTQNQLGKRFRIVISVDLLRRFFAAEIDAAGGGGGRGYSPRRPLTSPTRS